MNEQNKIKCFVCNSESTNVLFDSMKDFITNNEFKIYKCNECRISFTYPQPTDLDPYYPSEYRGYNTVILSLLKLFYARRVSRWVRCFERPGKVLEIGCGKGYMLNVFKKKGWEVLGTERSEEAAKYARETHGIKVHVGDLESISEKQKFDIIIMYNVLEHVSDPVNILKQCMKRLKDRGTLIINVHNTKSWQARFFGSSWSHLDPPRHLFHFEPKSMEYILNMTGLKTHLMKNDAIEFDAFGWILGSINQITGQYNHFARYLMGFERINKLSFLYLVCSFLLTGPSVLLSFISYFTNSGALMQINAKHIGEIY